MYLTIIGKYGVDHRKFKPKEVLGQQNKVLGKGNSDVSNVHGAQNSKYQELKLYGNCRTGIGFMKLNNVDIKTDAQVNEIYINDGGLEVEKSVRSVSYLI